MVSLIEKLRNSFINWLNAEVDNPREVPLTDFERIQYELRPCDVLLIEGRTRVSRVIKLITQSTWSHAALYIGRLHDISNRALRERVQQFYDGDPDEQLLVESLLGKGTIIVPLNKYRDDHIRICRPNGISRQDAQQVIGFVIGKLGIHYDVRQIFDLARFLFPWSFLPRRWRSSLFAHNPGGSTKESCATLLAEAFHSVDFPVLPILQENKERGFEWIQRNPRLFAPADFDYSPFFEIIKYPIVELGGSGVYHQLPWNKEMLSEDEGLFYVPEKEQKAELPVETKEEEIKKEPPVEFFD
jgi:hypothetical protein